MTAQQAVKKYVNNSDMVFVGGFGHAIPFLSSEKTKNYTISILCLNDKRNSLLIFTCFIRETCNIHI